MSLEAWGDEGDYGPELPEGWWDEDQVSEAEQRIAGLERQRDEMLAALKVAEELHRVGLFGAKPGQIQQVNDMRQAAIVKAEAP